MRRLTFFPLAAALVVTSVRGEEPKGDEKDVQGVWLVVDAELAGKKLALKDVELTLEKGKYTLKAESLDSGTYTMDPARKPKEMDIKGTDGPNKGKTFLCIYELTGDTLRVCYDLSGAARPKEFKTTAGTKLFLATYKRKKL